MQRIERMTGTRGGAAAEHALRLGGRVVEDEHVEDHGRLGVLEHELCVRLELLAVRV